MYIFSCNKQLKKQVRPFFRSSVRNALRKSLMLNVCFKYASCMLQVCFKYASSRLQVCLKCWVRGRVNGERLIERSGERMGERIMSVWVRFQCEFG